MTRTGHTSDFHDHDLASTDFQVASLDARISALSTAIEAHDARLDALEATTPPVEPPPTTPPPTGKVVKFGFSGTKTPAAFLALAADPTIDAIEWAPITYPWAQAVLTVARPASKPLLSFSEGDVVWDGTGTVNTPPWYVGNFAGAKAAYITFDARAYGGSFTAANYKLGKTGLIFCRNFDHIAFHGIKLVNVYGDPSAEAGTQVQHTHAVYLKTDPSYRSQYWASDDWEVIGPANKMLNGPQVDGSGGGVDHLHATGWKVENLNRWSYLWGTVTDVDISGWTGKNCTGTIDNYSGTNAAGKVSNCHATNCGPLKPGQGYWKAGALTDGGGNTSS